MTCHPGVAEDFLSGARFEISKWGKAERSAAELRTLNLALVKVMEEN